MAARKARSATKPRSAPRKKGGQPTPPWLYAAAGLLIGAFLVLSLQFTAQRVDEVRQRQTQKAAERSANKKHTTFRREEKASYDFYTILPEIETVIPSRVDPVERSKAYSSREPDQPSIKYLLQAASFDRSEEADKLRAKLVLNGFEAFVEKVTIQNRGDYYRVRVGPYVKYKDLEHADRKLSSLGIKAMRLRVRVGG